VGARDGARRHASLAVLLLVLAGAVVPVTPVAAVPGAGASHSTGPDAAASREPTDVTTTADATSVTNARNATTPAIVAVYPNPTTAEDAGEFVVVRTGGLDGLRLGDGESNVSLNATPSVVAVSPDPAVARNRTDHPVVHGDLALANGGERLVLAHGNATLDVVAYPDAPEGERWLQAERGRPASTASGDRWTWRPLGFEPRSVHDHGPANATVFVLPDAPGVPIETLRAADRRLLLGGYTLTASRVVDALVAAHRRGVTVRVLVDDAPVGGVGGREARALDRLSAAGVEVRVVGTGPARFDFHHPKYAVVDDRALVTSENWKPAGTGGNGSRGWGVRVDSPVVAADLAGLHRNDSTARDTTAWDRYREGETYGHENATVGDYPTRFQAERVRVEGVRVLTAPGNAERAVVDLLDEADESVAVIQPGIGGPHQPFLRATVRAARRGVEVRILLSSAWYAEEENERLVEWLNDLAAAEDLPLSAKLSRPGGRFEKVHTKGVVVDGETAVVGSLNWNNNSARENREVALVLEGEEAGGYYRRTFDADWRGGGSTRLPVGVVAGAAAAVLVALLVARREVTFDEDAGGGERIEGWQ
jgi:phosphatidylserine/phosphatidylglycerophosphate/cardiolipin synthase-like enzyme